MLMLGAAPAMAQLKAGIVGFPAEVRYPVGTAPADIAVGDINGDGKADLAVANATSNNVSILLGTGTGTFGAATQYPVGGGPASIAIGDVTGDGKADVVVANATDGTVSVLPGTGTNTPGTALLWKFNLTVKALTIGELNGDAWPELVMVGGDSHLVAVKLGAAAPKGNAPAMYTLGTHSPVGVAVGDVNNDGLADVVTANANTSTVTVLLGLGGGLIRVSGSYAAGNGNQSVFIAELTGDGKADLATTNYTKIYYNLTTMQPENRPEGVSILAGTGTGSFGAPANKYMGSSVVPGAAIGDLEGDGRPEIVATNSEGQSLDVAFSGGAPYPVSIPTDEKPIRVAIADLNGDGQKDLILVNQSTNSVSVMLGKRISPMTPVSVGGSPRAMVVADLNGDGKADIATASHTSSTFSVLLGTGSGSFAPATTTALGFAPSSIAAADFNADGKLDLAIANIEGKSVSIFPGSGGGTFGTKTEAAVGSRVSSVVTGDLDGALGADLIMATESGVVTLLNKGTGLFGAPTTYKTGDYPSSNVAVGELNGDGKLDVVVSNSMELYVFLGKGETLSTPIYLQAPHYPGGLAVGKVDTVYGLDLVVACDKSIALATYISQGNGTFKAAAKTKAGAGPVSVALADLNGDKKLDAITIGPDNFSVLLGAGTGTFAVTRYLTPVGSSWGLQVATADFNLDGKVDIALGFSGIQSVFILLGEGKW